ncbi:uncharacterized protein RAG0_05222 [Rhynchosporium agropyri]|uniref:Uncharacterized protein n=1 Tax=Rhynchosporium agropyri TaxID=914238 RepID=A0A1E1KC46_9HELO|nr:uncharacterized protein RAG0_05222 [Rhynchosporium agropyri]
MTSTHIYITSTVLALPNTLAQGRASSAQAGKLASWQAGTTVGERAQAEQSKKKKQEFDTPGQNQLIPLFWAQQGHWVRGKGQARPKPDQDQDQDSAVPGLVQVSTEDLLS